MKSNEIESLFLSKKWTGPFSLQTIDVISLPGLRYYFSTIKKPLWILNTRTHKFKWLFYTTKKGFECFKIFKIKLKSNLVEQSQ